MESKSDRKQGFAKIEELKKVIDSEKKERDALNQDVKNIKQERNSILRSLNILTSKFNRLLSGIKSFDFSQYHALKERFDSLSWKYQTEVFSMDKEKGIVKELDEMESEIASLKEVRVKQGIRNNLQKKISELRNKAMSLHELVTQKAKLSEEHHQKMLAASKELREAYHKLKAMPKRINQPRPSRQVEHMVPRLEMEEQLPEELKQKASQLYEDFKKGKKITNEELLLLQKVKLC